MFPHFDGMGFSVDIQVKVGCLFGYILSMIVMFISFHFLSCFCHFGILVS